MTTPANKPTRREVEDTDPDGWDGIAAILRIADRYYEWRKHEDERWGYFFADSDSEQEGEKR